MGFTLFLSFSCPYYSFCLNVCKSNSKSVEIRTIASRLIIPIFQRNISFNKQNKTFKTILPLKSKPSNYKTYQFQATKKGLDIYICLPSSNGFCFTQFSTW